MPNKRIIPRRPEMRQLPSVPIRELDRKFIRELKELKESNKDLRRSNDILQKKVDRIELWILANFGNLDNPNGGIDEAEDNINIDTNEDPLPHDLAGSNDDDDALNEHGCSSPNTSSNSSVPKIRAKRNELNLEDKLTVIKLIEEGKLSQRKVARQFNVGKSQVGNILRSKTEISEAYERFLKDTGGISRPDIPIPSRIEKKNKNGEVRHHHLVNRQVKLYYDERLALGIYTTGPQLQEKARELASQYGVTKFGASSGWLHNFTKKFRIRLGLQGKLQSKSTSLRAATNEGDTNCNIINLNPEPETAINVEPTVIKMENFEMECISPL